MTVTIRPIAQADRQVWGDLWEQYNQFYKRTITAEVTDTTFSRFLDENVRIYGVVAEFTSEDQSAEKRVIGFAHYYPHPSTSFVNEVVYLHDLFVDPGVRNQGTGRQLIQRVYDYAARINAGEVYWHTQFYNHRAQLLYTKVADRTDFVVYSKTV